MNGRRIRTALLATLSSALVLATLPAAASAETDPYGAAMWMTFGVHEDAMLEARVTLPAPGDGGPVTEVRFSWEQAAPIPRTRSTVAHVVETPHCLGGVECVLEATLPTSRMDGSYVDITATASGAAGVLGSRTETVDVVKPALWSRPVPMRGTHWGDVTLAAEAGAAEEPGLKGVRFYLNPEGVEDDVYLFDDAPPYEVTVPATEIATPAEYGVFYTVAEDLHGNLSTWWRNGTDAEYVQVGPPPLVTFPSGLPDGAAAGGTSTGASIGWKAAIPDYVPGEEGVMDDPHITEVQVFLDGNPKGEWIADPITFEGPEVHRRWRWVSDSWDGDAGTGLTGGEHVLTVRATTSYGATGESSKPFLVTDGVVLSALRRGRRVVRNGFVVTAGTKHRFRYRVTGKIPGTPILRGDLRTGGRSLVDPNDGTCQLDRRWECPTVRWVVGNWKAPVKAGRYPLRHVAQGLGDAELTRRVRWIRVQPAAHLSAAVSKREVAPRERFVVRGRLTRTDTGSGVRGVPVKLRWRRAGTTRWRSLDTVTSGRYGRVRLPVRGRWADGVYQWVTSGEHGRIGPARSRRVLVTVRR